MAFKQPRVEVYAERFVTLVFPAVSALGTEGFQFAAGTAVYIDSEFVKIVHVFLVLNGYSFFCLAAKERTKEKSKAVYASHKRPRMGLLFSIGHF
ncbi:hypothetical protein [uncultured Bacteroides sp.]|uniref:hypothetical protein n=1 Tax=uncultured Bacteroides sp. TaxID=162156 RepID=UPI002AA8AA2A|nr:hypothetical protein [uncultured Bacteroides sp.]